MVRNNWIAPVFDFAQYDDNNDFDVVEAEKQISRIK